MGSLASNLEGLPEASELDAEELNELMDVKDETVVMDISGGQRKNQAKKHHSRARNVTMSDSDSDTEEEAGTAKVRYRTSRNSL